MIFARIQASITLAAVGVTLIFAVIASVSKVVGEEAGNNNAPQVLMTCSRKCLEVLLCSANQVAQLPARVQLPVFSMHAHECLPPHHVHPLGAGTVHRLLLLSPAKLSFKHTCSHHEEVELPWSTLQPTGVNLLVE